MDEQQLQEMEAWISEAACFSECDEQDEAALWSLIAEVRRLQQQVEVGITDTIVAECIVDEVRAELAQTHVLLNNATRLAGEAADQRDAALAERDALKATTSREEDHWYAKWVDERAALSEARRVLREVQTPPGLDDPIVWAGVPPDWFTRRDAVLAQEEK